MHRLESIIRQANSANRQALIPFLTAGFPDKSKFWPEVLELDRSGADIIEIGVPFSDPVADGVVVEAASRQALSEGVRLGDILKELRDMQGLIHAGIVLMGYYNPFLQYGLERFAKEAKECGVAGIIVPDLPLEEAGPFRSYLKAEDLALIPLVGLNTSYERLCSYAEVAEGYAYVVSVLGVTGGQNQLTQAVSETLIRAKKAFRVPVALGFGLKEPSQLANLAKDAQPEAVVFGSALLQHLQLGGHAHEFMAKWFTPSVNN